jgi:hypothetical protein
LLACGAEVDAVPEGKLALVGERPLGEEDVAATQAQLGAYGQARFRGKHGERALLEAKVMEALLEMEAIDAGLGEDPRVHWAVTEELASLQLTTEIERRLPREELAADTDALRRVYKESEEELMLAERRSFRGVRLKTMREAASALASLRAGESRLSDHGKVVTTSLAEREDENFPAFHRVLFDPELAVGDWLPQPVISDGRLLVGQVHEIVPAKPRPFDDPDVQERLIQTLRAERVAELRPQILAELAEKYPEEAP